MAEKLVQSGFTAGDGYGEVWIRDLNSFVELSTKVNGQERTREALLMFLSFSNRMEIFQMAIFQRRALARAMYIKHHPMSPIIGRTKIPSKPTRKLR